MPIFVISEMLVMFVMLKKVWVNILRLRIRPSNIMIFNCEFKLNNMIPETDLMKSRNVRSTSLSYFWYVFLYIFNSK